MASALYLVAAYWPYLVVVFAVGMAIGWWAEARRDPADVSGWLERGGEEP